ncbi:septation inhibitor domain protein [Aeromicrobium marinum DSM 15272]|uniref:Cell division protein CrgA n=1 Tax=Aeromicrobium marinum DSM 15272 TaxID=585531 RepID=E2S8T6_9ACTN|nr:cell division protein CrgA [Aeromicrobium marinum]EFQ84591.1 septation inhibitor domain protein [Aeromicrobium marinum DSM 15272]
MAQNKKTRTRRGGWFHPAAIVLLLVGVVWGVGYLFFVRAWDFPGIGRIDPIADLGHWNWAIAAVLVVAASLVAGSTAPEPEPGQSVGWRYAAPLMIGSAAIGLVWIVTFYTLANTDIDIPLYSDLGNWNLVIGMGFIVGAFGFAMKWE